MYISKKLRSQITCLTYITRATFPCHRSVGLTPLLHFFTKKLKINFRIREHQAPMIFREYNNKSLSQYTYKNYYGQAIYKEEYTPILKMLQT